MAKSFKEIHRKAEELIEQGREADSNVEYCQGRVSSAASSISSAQADLAYERSRTDSEGNHNGDVSGAEARLAMAEQQFAASQRALERANQEKARIEHAKEAHIQEIDNHNRIERANLEKLRALQSQAFSENSAMARRGMIERFNEAEDARVELLRSMGIEATPEYMSTGEGGNSNAAWSLGGFSSLDLAGQEQSYQGGGGEGMAAATGAAGVGAPVGGALGPAMGGSAAGGNPVGMNGIDPITGQSIAAGGNGGATGVVNGQAASDIVNGGSGTGSVPGSMSNDSSAMNAELNVCFNSKWNSTSDMMNHLSNLRGKYSLVPDAQYHEAVVNGIRNYATNHPNLSQQDKSLLGNIYIDSKLKYDRNKILDSGANSVMGINSVINDLRATYGSDLIGYYQGSSSNLFANVDYADCARRANLIRPSLSGTMASTPMSIREADSGHVNPNYTGEQNGYYFNCQTCVAAFEARMRGYNVYAKPYSDTSFSRTLSFQTNLAWIDPKTGNHPNYICNENIFKRVEYAQYIDSVVKPGERYTLEFNYKGINNGGHIVNLYRNQYNDLVLLDNQRGNGEQNEFVGVKELADYFNSHKVRFRRFDGAPDVPQLLRVDNMDLNYAVLNDLFERY